MAEVLHDVVIVGGGPVGACAGALLAGADGGRALSVALIEPHAPQPQPAPQPAGADLRVVALSRASERILERAGAWPAILAGPRSPIERMRVWHESVSPADPAVLVFDAADVGEPDLGIVVANRRLQAALLDAFARTGGRIVPAHFARLAIEDARVRVATSQGELAARLVIGADGAQSAVREALGLDARIAPYGETAIVANVTTAQPHEATAWQRFMHDGTLAFLPLADGSSSIVWSADDALARELLGLDAAAFAQRLDRASDLALGVTRLASERAAFPLRRLSAQRYVAPRLALIGDAAHVVHPLAGQGVNLGLLDAAALCQEVRAAIARREDPGALGVLRAYERWRRSEVALIANAMDVFDRLLAHGSGPLSRLAQRGLGQVGRSAEARRFFIRRAMGLTGELPEAALPRPAAAP